MSSNVASASGATANPLQVDRDGIKAFLQENKARFDLEDRDIDNIYNQKIDGATFAELTQEDLTGIGILLGPAKKIVKFVKEITGEQPAVGPLLNEEVVGQIKFLYEHIKSESESASLSTVNEGRFRNFLNFTNLTVKYVRFCGTYLREDIDPYKWNAHTESNKSQLKKIISYLDTHLKPILPDEIVIEDVANKKDFLKIRKSSVMPFNISGGTDVILVERQCVVGNLRKLGIYAIFELKKAVEERHIFQAILEMIIADCYVGNHVKVFGVLTDLKSIWNIFWLSVNKEIIVVSLTNRRLAFDVINEMVRSDNPSIEGISNTKRVKYTELFDERIDTPYDDIAPMEDFVEDMDENEVLLYKTKKVINALKYNPIFSSMLESPPNNPTFPSMLESLPSSFCTDL